MSFKISDLIDLDKIPMKIIIFLGIVSGIFVLASDSFLRILKMTEFEEDYGKFFGPIFIASIAFIGLSVIYYIKDKLEYQFNRNKGNKIIIEELESLDPFEQSVIWEFAIQQKKSVKMPIDNSTVVGLINKEILKRVSNIGDGLYFPLTLTTLADRKLKETHLGLSKELTEEELSEIFSFRPDWATDYFYQQHCK
ncbi:superinfection exclusion B family protein [Marivirga sp. S37H4]|uniref:Superinfection exclusion B family protein n=1 Tax=Marivirga aurantiaca TaxID=2802615 RepID=A0A934X0M1_9BACT|nr:super-infection exclusion protein B [Marivirga aurantiaca]MBK6266176.1 superinfection exclusion B family protein [Marivirga aurantiaca]